MLNCQANNNFGLGLFLRKVASKPVFSSSGILSFQKLQQGWDFRRSYKSLKTAVVSRPDRTNFLPHTTCLIRSGTPLMWAKKNRWAFLLHSMRQESMVTSLSSKYYTGHMPLLPIPFGSTTIPNWARPISSLLWGPSQLGPAFGLGLPDWAHPVSAHGC
jgi:hypothetical protein